ncbi:hypothetical protein TREMEDRAFT_61299 [Tremella mesenterica DSM 1558]|uniref:uncharacterized protein n=1 Tax=Tremella mesenterica (strain ATCC 24925 / CBS 8224 / DSM 1558 / NBRC 9311 / NRRL Y-6157 / RJB 2259-6 / UBC 559-6) TaxID=578456 RepID=UPI0003F4A65E|nr:uncharacterized protein TREMEDRAFT_61299 [Tremella mesenterica DSM 1558]EIW70792.1 hypothetical protein TREMEDRAFT_61299 [Tremella mesenterica DSM 1558]
MKCDDILVLAVPGGAALVLFFPIPAALLSLTFAILILAGLALISFAFARLVLPGLARIFAKNALLEDTQLSKVLLFQVVYRTQCTLAYSTLVTSIASPDSTLSRWLLTNLAIRPHKYVSNCKLGLFGIAPIWRCKKLTMVLKALLSSSRQSVCSFYVESILPFPLMPGKA